MVDILAGRIIPLRLGYVPVVNRGQRDIEANKPISAALDYERDFFENHASYKGKAQYCGTPFLAVHQPSSISSVNSASMSMA